MFSPGAEMSGYVDWSPALPREEKSETVPSRVPVSWSLYDATEMMPPVGSLPGGLDRLAEPSPPSLPLAHTVTTPSADQRALELGGRRARVERAAAGRAVGVVGDLDRRAGAGRDAGAARGVVVLEHPVQRGVGADDEQAGAGGEVDQLGAGSGALELRAVGQRGRATGDDAVHVGAVAAEREGVGVDGVRHLLHRAAGSRSGRTASCSWRRRRCCRRPP